MNSDIPTRHSRLFISSRLNYRYEPITTGPTVAPISDDLVIKHMVDGKESVETWRHATNSAHNDLRGKMKRLAALWRAGKVTTATWAFAFLQWQALDAEVGRYLDRQKITLDK